MKKRNSKPSRLVSEHSRDQYTGEKGFTLMEATIAMVLMAIVGLGIASVFSYSVSNTATAADRLMATAVAQQRMEQLRNVAFTDAALTATSSAGITTAVTRAGRVYSIVTQITDSNVLNLQPTLKTITIRVVPSASSQSWTTTTTSLFGSVTLVLDRSAQPLGPNRTL